jgi:hypothetical protein
MPRRLVWKDDLDTTIRTKCWEGATWDEIALAVGCGRWAAIKRGDVVGARRRPSVPDSGAPAVLMGSDERRSLVAGHELTWGAMIRGTLLEGLAYPPYVSPVPIRTIAALI